MSSTPLRGEVLGQGHGAGFGHAKGHRTGAAQHQHVLRRNAQRGIVHALGVLWTVEHDGRPAMLVQVRRRGGLLQDRAVRRQGASQHHEGRGRPQRRVQGADRGLPCAGGGHVLQELAERLAADSFCIEVEHGLQRLEQDGNAAGLVEILHSTRRPPACNRPAAALAGRFCGSRPASTPRRHGGQRRADAPPRWSSRSARPAP